jgi:F-type H+-transporting ATPase subunit alpha
VIIIYAATNGYLGSDPVEQLRAYEIELYKFLDTRKSGLMKALSDKKQIDDAVKADLNQSLEEFGKSFAASNKTAAA